MNVWGQEEAWGGQRSEFILLEHEHKGGGPREVGKRQAGTGLRFQTKQLEACPGDAEELQEATSRGQAWVGWLSESPLRAMGCDGAGRKAGRGLGQFPWGEERPEEGLGRVGGQEG